MVRLLTHYRGQGLEPGIAKIIDKLAYRYKQECVTEPMDPDTVRLWFESPDYEPEMFAATILDSGNLAGYAWAWVNVENEPAPLSWITISLNPELTWSDLIDTILMLLSWARHSLEAWQEARGLVEVRLGPLGGFIHELARSIVSCTSGSEVPSGYLMLSPSEGVKARLPTGYKVEEIRPDKSREDAEAVVEVFNSSFSIYEDFWPWRIERAMQYYENLYSKRDAMVLLARDTSGQPAGFVEAYKHPTLCGTSAGHISLLAVSRKHQGKGLGRALLGLAEEWLKNRNASIIYLYAVPRASALYLKLGYRIISITIKARLPLYCLPRGPYSGIQQFL